jgi:hypothetical protein
MISDWAAGRLSREGGNTMADLIAIGYPDETTADAAAEAHRLAADLIIQPDAIAVIEHDWGPRVGHGAGR